MKLCPLPIVPAILQMLWIVLGTIGIGSLGVRYVRHWIDTLRPANGAVARKVIDFSIGNWTCPTGWSPTKHEVLSTSHYILFVYSYLPLARVLEGPS